MIRRGFDMRPSCAHLICSKSRYLNLFSSISYFHLVFIVIRSLRAARRECKHSPTEGTYSRVTWTILSVAIDSLQATSFLNPRKQSHPRRSPLDYCSDAGMIRASDARGRTGSIRAMATEIASDRPETLSDGHQLLVGSRRTTVAVN